MSETETIVGLLVGMHFNPPAKWVIEHLRSGTKLKLMPEPDNPYDANAVKVFVADGEEVPEGQQAELESKLAGTSFGLEDVSTMISAGSLLLGHLAAENGKPLAQAQGSGAIGNLSIARAIDESGLSMEEAEASLGFAPDGKPLVMIKLPVEV